MSRDEFVVVIGGYAAVLGASGHIYHFANF